MFLSTSSGHYKYWVMRQELQQKKTSAATTHCCVRAPMAPVFYIFKLLPLVHICFSSLAAPLTSLLKLTWSPTAAFTQLDRAFTTAPILKHPAKPFICTMYMKMMVNYYEMAMVNDQSIKKSINDVENTFIYLKYV